MPVRNYTYYDYTTSLCPDCLKRVGAKIIIEEDEVFMTKDVRITVFKTKIATDVHYYKTSETITKPPKCLCILVQT